LGTNTYQIVEGQYLRDILDQPGTPAATLEQLEVAKELAILAARLREGLKSIIAGWIKTIP